MANFASNPGAESCRRLDFESAVVRTGIVPNTHFLIVHGTAPCLNMEVSLSPLVYIACPEYWGIEVIGCLPNGICLDAIKQYTVTIQLSGIIGSEGIEVVGATKREKIKVTGGCKPLSRFS